jgi:hypothetical protein
MSSWYRSLSAAILLVATAGCGSDTNPASGGNCGTIVGNQGTVTAQVAGASFSGIVPTGLTTNVGGVLSVSGQNTDNSTLYFSIPAGVGVKAVGGANAGSLSFQTRSCTAGTGLWVANAAGGTGTITILTLTATGATGTFAGTLQPQSGSGATGEKLITAGQFTVTF